MRNSRDKSKENLSGKNKRRKNKKMEREERKKEREKKEREEMIEIKRVIEEWKIWDNKKEIAKLEKEAKKLVSSRFY